MRIYRRAKLDSSRFEWRYDVEEIFHFLMGRFNINMAKKIIEASPRPVQLISLESMKGIIPRRPVAKDKSGPVSVIGVDWERIDGKDIDLNVPLIVATLENGAIMPIDGWHRLAKALDQNIMTLPAVFLTKKETAAIMR